LRVIASYHPALQNTNTGKLTRPMFLSIFKRAKVLANAADRANAHSAKSTSNARKEQAK
jgi:hypothetical protein